MTPASHFLRLVLALAAVLAASGPAIASPPVVVGWTPLSALPAEVAQGNSGPINRFAFDLEHFDPADGGQVVCTYPGGFAYRCPFEVQARDASGRRRVLVQVSDLDRGNAVTVRFANARGERSVALELVNRPQVVHEIESIALPEGGKTTTDGAGRPAPVLDLAQLRATTLPVIAASAPRGAPAACDRVYAVWISVAATDPVFPSAFGALDGTVIPSRPPPKLRPVREDTAPEWLVTYPRAAQRVQFIAHYEIGYRVAECAPLVVR